MPHLRRLLQIALVVLGALIPAAAGAADVQTFFNRSKTRLVQVAESSGTERLRGCERLVSDMFRLPAMARSVASPERWNAMRSETRDRLVGAVSGRLAKECASLVDRTDPRAARIGRVRETTGGMRLTVLMPRDANDESVVVWARTPGGGHGWTATDLSVDGRGAAATFRQDFENALTARPGPINDAIAYFAEMRSR